MNKYIQSTRTVVCDIDDTISFTTSRDWENAKPNIRLIEKLNNLYDNGWTIIYCTSRGSLSCKNRQEAKKKYKKIILDWFKKNNVKYSKLSFQKFLAQYYIDDKAILPDDFANINIEVIKSTEDTYIQKIDNKLFKTKEGTIDEAYWYKECSKLFKNIKLYSLVGKTICIDYVKNNSKIDIDLIENTLEKFKTKKINSQFKNYILDIEKKLYYNIKYNKILDFLYQNENYYNENSSFCHNNLSIEHMIFNNDELFLISPKMNMFEYSSYLLDIAKLMTFENQIGNYFNKKYTDIRIKVLKFCEMIKHDFNTETINTFYNLIKEEI